MSMGNQPTGPTDKDLEQVLAAYRELGGDEPPELLDQAVLNKARAAVARPRRAWSWNMGWAHGLGTAAGVLLVVTVFIQMRSEIPRTAEPALRDAIQQESAHSRMRQPAATVEQSRDEPSRMRSDRPAEQPVPEQEFFKTQSQQLEKRSVDTDLKQEGQARRKPGKEQAAGFADTEAADPPPLAAPALAPVNAAAAMEGEDIVGEDMESSAAGAGMAMESDAMQLDELKADARDDNTVNGYRQLHLEEAASEVMVMPPDAWLERLRELQEGDDQLLFQAELEAFQLAYPDFELPADLLE